MIRVDVIDMDEVVEMVYELETDTIVLMTDRSYFDVVAKAFNMKNYIRFVLDDLDEFVSLIMKMSGTTTVYVF